MKLDNKVAIITGSSRGIGRATALRFASEGARLIINHRDNDDLARNVAEECRDQGAEAIVVQADVTQLDDCRQLCTAACKAYGRLDIVISNAGIIVDKPFVASGAEDWTRIVDVNMRAFFNILQSALPTMIEQMVRAELQATRAWA